MEGIVEIEIMPDDGVRTSLDCEASDLTSRVYYL